MPKQGVQSQVREALEFVFQRYLSKPMTDVSQSRDFFIDPQGVAHGYLREEIPEI